jgi:hypothetical protein
MKKTLITLTLLSLLVGCGGTSKSKSTIDIADYLPSEDVENTYIHTSSSGTRDQTVEEVSINNNIITIKVEDNISKTITINEQFIVVKELNTNLTKTYERFISKGGTLYTLSISTVNEEIKFEESVIGTKSTDSTKKCKLKGKIDKLHKDTFIQFTGDILEFECIESKSIVTQLRDGLPDFIDLQEGEEKTDDDISYFYMKKGIGVIAEINDDCIIKDADGKKTINDTLQECHEEEYEYNSLF